MDINFASQQIIKLLQSYADFWGTSHGITRKVLIDEKQHSYQLISMGWYDGQRYVYNIAFHLEIIDGKIWLQQNNTDILIADELIENGIPKDKIVLGFIAPQDRLSTGFAA